MYHRKFFILMIALVAMAVGLTATVSAQSENPTYNEEWLREIVAGDATMENLFNAWITRVGDVWRTEKTSAGTYDIVANSVVFGATMQGGNDPAFELLKDRVYFTPEGGRFNASGPFRAFQLEGAYHGTSSDRPASVDEMVELAKSQPDYGRMITSLDVEWSNGNGPINRWGSSGPLEVLTDQQLATLETAGLELQPVIQVLPGNTVVWGELAPGEHHFGLVAVPGMQNVYLSTCLGGQFATLRGFRAMQFPPAFENALVPDMDGCNPQSDQTMLTYPILDPSDPKSAAPLDPNNGG